MKKWDVAQRQPSNASRLVRSSFYWFIVIVLYLALYGRANKSDSIVPIYEYSPQLRWTTPRKLLVVKRSWSQTVMSMPQQFRSRSIVTPVNTNSSFHAGSIQLLIMVVLPWSLRLRFTDIIRLADKKHIFLSTTLLASESSELYCWVLLLKCCYC